MIKSRRRKALIAAILVSFLFLFSSFSVAASSAYSNTKISDSVNGVPFTFEINYMPDSEAWDAFLYSYSPIFYNDGRNPYGENYSYSGSYFGNSQRISANLEIYDDVSLSHFAPIGRDFPGNMRLSNLVYDDTGHFSGSAAKRYNFYLNGEFSYFSASDYEASIKAQDFSCWIDSNGVSGTEIFFDFLMSLDSYSGYTQFFYPMTLDVSYSLYGDSNNVETVSFDMGQADFFYDGCLIVTPEVLGFTDPNTYIYIHDMQLNYVIDADPGYIFSRGMEYRFDVVYTFNPDLYLYSYGSSTLEPGGGNPALPLLSYTEWIGNAVSGVLDLELFPYFTLGGILMTLLAFVCVVWFLKLVAGG